MVSVQEQYEAYPYPERKPEDEKKRMVTGSPSYPEEIDHFLHGGARDWSQPFRALVAGGGTGDALIQMAQVLTSAGRPYELTYLDLSSTSRQIAEARAEMRGLTGITFHTGSLLDAADLGSFDYIDCCGVLHHLPNPAEGFAALRSALAPGGGMGFMVYAPYGRSGVYPLQEAFGALLDGLPPKARLERGREIVRKLPPGHPFRCNPNLRDHRASEAGFYDLLLHSQDQAFDVASLLQVLDDTGWQLLSFATPALYDLARITGKPADNDRPDSLDHCGKAVRRDQDPCRLCGAQGGYASGGARQRPVACAASAKHGADDDRQGRRTRPAGAAEIRPDHHAPDIPEIGSTGDRGDRRAPVAVPDRGTVGSGSHRLWQHLGKG